MIERREHWSGPLPPPAVLEHFNSVVHNGAERIFQAWEGETAHRQDMERRDFRWSVFEALFGKILAFLFVVSALGLAGYAASIGAAWVGAVIAGATLISVVWAFVKSNRGK